MIALQNITKPKKFDIVLTRTEWEKFRPTVKELQEKAQLNYTVQDYVSNAKGEPTVLVTCLSTEKAETIIDAELTEILGHVYA